MERKGRTRREDTTEGKEEGNEGRKEGRKEGLQLCFVL
jgi:hypothetical protein